MSRIIDVSKASKANILKEQGEPVSTEDIAIYTYEEIVNILNENNTRLTAFDIENGVFTYDLFDGETTTTITKDITPFIDSLFARKISPTFTGTVSGITKSMVGLGNVDNTSDANKPISTATQTALNDKENILIKGNITSNDITIEGGVGSIIGSGVVLSLNSNGRIRHFSGSEDVTNTISLQANIGDIYFNTATGIVYQKSNLTFPSGLNYITLPSGTWVKLGDFTLNKSKVGLSNVDNTSDLSKPISTLTQTALDGKVDKYRKFETTSTQWQEFNWSFAGTGSDTSLKLINNTRNGAISLREALVIYQGKVSIGGNGVADNTPTKELDVKGEALVNGGLYLNSYQYSADKLLKTVTSASGVQVVSTDLSVTNDDKLGLGTSTPAGKLDVVSTTMPSYPFPRMTTTQIDALVGMVEGAWVFDITTHHPKYYNGTTWVQI